MPDVALSDALADGYRLQFYITQQSQSQSGNSSVIGWSLVIYKGNGSGKYASGQGWWSVTIDGQYREGPVNGYDFRSIPAGGFLTLGQGTMTIKHNSDGTKTISGQAGFADIPTYGELGNGQIGPGPLLTLTRIPKVPAAPKTPVLSSTTTTSVTYTFAAPNNNGSSIQTFNHQAATNSSFTTGVQNWNDGSTPTSRSGLSPNTRYYFRCRAVNGVGAGPWSGTMSAVTKIALPGAPTFTAIDQITPTSLRYRFASGSTGGSSILEWQAQIATNSGFTTGVQTVTSNGTTVFEGLVPGTTYYVRARGRNSAGWGPYGATGSGKTIAVAAPTLKVVAAVSGLSATATVTPPSNVTPTGYSLQRRVQGSTTVTTIPMTSTTKTVTDLAPGITYEWRAAVVVGTYTGPYTAWLAVTQPAPSTSPGDYFDGSTPAKPNVTYAWDGTANASTSTATGKVPLGWALTTETTSSAALYMQTGGRTRAYAARLAFTVNKTAPGFGAGQSIAATGRSEAAGSGTYWGSIYVLSPNRSQLMAARIRWIDAAGAVLETSEFGDPVLVGGDDWIRVTVLATAPTGTAYAAVQVLDVAGDGWSAWKSGDYIVLDDAMLTLGQLYPYFDGSTPDDAGYDYSWTGTKDASPSQRVTIIQPTVDPFTDPDCAVVPSPPRPPVVDVDCITDTGTWRRYWAVVAPQYILDWIADLPTVTLTNGSVPSRQVRLRYYENPDGVSPDVFDASSWVSEQIVSYMPQDSTYVLSGVDESMVGTVTFGDSWTNVNHLLYGTGSTPATWPVLRCGIGYLISFDVPLDAPEGNLGVSVQLTRRY